MAKRILYVLLTVIILPLAFHAPRVGLAGSPEPPGTAFDERLSGPAFVGTVKLSQEFDSLSIPIMDAHFVGTCKGIPADFHVRYFNKTVASQSADTLEDHRPLRIDDPRLNGCYDRLSSGGDAIIATVIDFAFTSPDFSTAEADIVAMAVVPK